MTKTTNFEISKKLEEIGFKDSYIFSWYIDEDGGKWIQEIKRAQPFLFNKYSDKVKVSFVAPAYDLETLLEALPNFIENGNGTENCLVVDVAFGEIHYEGDCENDALFITTTRENESLADTAGRLIILLHEKNLIKF